MMSVSSYSKCLTVLNFGAILVFMYSLHVALVFGGASPIKIIELMGSFLCSNNACQRPTSTASSRIPSPAMTVFKNYLNSYGLVVHGDT